MFWRKAKPPPVQLGFIIFGLGNPGPQYAHTRHNAGWWALDELERRHKAERTIHQHGGQADFVKMDGPDGRASVALVKPTTFMNRSGNTVRAWLHAYSDVPWVVVYDDIDLPTGKLRLRSSGSAGGHNGMKSVVGSVGTQEFTRLRIGVGSPPGSQDSADYVLEAPSRAEREAIEGTLPIVCDVLELLVANGFEAAQRKMAQLGNPE